MKKGGIACAAAIATALAAVFLLFMSRDQEPVGVTASISGSAHPTSDPSGQNGLTAPAAEQSSEEAAPFVYISPATAVKEMTPGWNLGNTLDATPTEGAWGNRAAERTFDDIIAAGFRSVRIPVTWDSHIGPAPDYVIDEGWMNRVEQVVDWALERDLYVMLNSHHDSWLWMNLDKQDDPEESLRKFERVWLQIAERFKYKSAKLMLEILNEPTDMPPEQMNEIDELIVKAIRSTGGYNDKRLVVVAGLWNDSEQALEHFIAPDDEHIILTVHYYSPWDFLNNWWGRSVWGSDEDKREVDDLFGRLHEQFIASGLPVIIGEYGSTMRVDGRSKYVYYDYIASAAHRYGMAMLLWDNGENLNRATGDWRDRVSKDIVVQSGNGAVNSFLDPTDLYVKADSSSKEAVIDLELNGNELQGIWNGDEELRRDEDYTVSAEGKQVIIRHEVMASLRQEGVLGQYAALRFAFSKGADQLLQLIQYDKPGTDLAVISLESIGGNTYDQRLHISFNGTKPQAVQAVNEHTGQYVTDAGRQYLRMYDHFDYDSTTLILKKDFLNMIESDTDLTVKLWPEGESLKLKIKVPEQ